MYQAHRKLFYDTTWLLRDVAHMRNMLASFHVIYTGAGNWIQSDLLFDNPFHLSAQSAAQFNQRLRSLLGHDTVNLSILSAAALAQGSFRP